MTGNVDELGEAVMGRRLTTTIGKYCNEIGRREEEEREVHEMGEEKSEVIVEKNCENDDGEWSTKAEPYELSKMYLNH